MPHFIRTQEQIMASDMVALLLAYADFIAVITFQAEAPSRVLYEKSMTLDSY